METQKTFRKEAGAAACAVFARGAAGARHRGNDAPKTRAHVARNGARVKYGHGIVTAAVNETIYSGGVDYDQLISFEKDNEGKITAVKSNMAEFNRLQSAIIDEVLEKLSEVTTKELSVPVGTLLGSPFLAGRGPLIRVRMQSVGSSSAHFENAFTSAGINQTKHQIYLVVDVYVSILLPGFSTTTKFSNTYSVAETVIVGSVPDNYTYFSNGEDMEQNAEDYIMNNG